MTHLSLEHSPGENNEDQGMVGMQMASYMASAQLFANGLRHGARVA